MRLTEVQIRTAKPTAKPQKLFDGGGLFLLVAPAGGKWWRLKYLFGGKEKLLSLGTYPQVPLKAARNKATDARRLIADGVDPSELRKVTKRAGGAADGATFQAVALEWFTKHKPTWVDSHSEKIRSRLERDLFPWLGHRPIKEITAPELLACLRRIEARGALDTAHRAHQNTGQIFRYAVATGKAERDPSGDLRGALPPAKATHHASITEPKAVGDLLRAIDGYQGTLAVRCALRLAPLVFTRPGELRQAEWAEIDLAQAEWRIPAEKMKARAPHIVPLASQSVAILEEIRPLTGAGRYVFPSARSPKGDRPMSNNAVLAALRRLGFDKDTMTGHGFRSMASTLLNEQGWHRDAIERQLAHAERDEVRAAYNYAEHLPERRRMVQAWADYLDGLRQGANVVPIRRAAE